MAILDIPRSFPEPDQSYFLFGARGTGKSTMVGHRHTKALLINLLIPRTLRTYLARPEELLDTVRAQNPGQTIIIDEVQKAPNLLPLVHALIEEKKDWKFILTGSSARKLKREGVDLLGGRALKKSLHPFMASELGEHFHLQDALLHGLLPLRFASKSPDETLATYVSLYLEEEVKSEGLVRNIEPFARFLETLSFSHGSILNVSNTARECAIKRATADTWLSIVEDLLIAYTVPVFKRRAKRVLTSQLKWYLFDAGVYRAIRPMSVLDHKSEIEGTALEGLVAQHLRAWIDYTRKSHSLYYWRTKSGLEVDFIVFGELGLWAIEVKNATQIHPRDLTGLEHFKQDYPEAKTILLYRGDEATLKKGILCLPCEDFLKKIVPNRPLLDEQT